MARKTNEEISKMPIVDAVNYAEEHPAEAGRISKVLGKATAKTSKIAVQYTISAPLQWHGNEGLINLN